jgi:3-oxoadipate enol-lactonase
MVHERFATVGGRPTRYLEAGSGRPLVFIHAFPFNAEMWRPQFEQVPAGWRFLAPDLRGFGGTVDDASPAETLKDHADDLVALMDALTIQDAVIAGLSMGGYIAFALFRLDPSRLAGLILADTRPQPDSPEGLRSRRALLERLHAHGVAAVADDLLPKLVGETSRRQRPEVVATVRRLIEASPPEAIEAAVHALMARPDSTPDLDRIRCATLVIVGAEDSITPPADAEMMHRRIDGSTLVVLQNAGHLSNVEVPDAFNAAMLAFLSKRT